MFTFKNFRNVYRHGKQHSAMERLCSQLYVDGMGWDGIGLNGIDYDRS